MADETTSWLNECGWEAAMQSLISSIKTYLQQEPVTSWLIIIGAVGALLFLVMLRKSGWRFGSLKKVKVGPVEAERFEPTNSDSRSPTQADVGAINTKDINVSVTGNTFGGKVGDIGGVIDKSDSTGTKK